MKKGLIYLLFALPLTGWSQETDSTSVPPVSPAFYFDYGKAAGSVIPEYQKWEGGFELIFLGRIQGVVELGQWKLNPDAIENGHYWVEGTYTRFGVGYIPYVDAGSRIGVGFRYATSSYSDRGDYTILSGSDLQPDIVETFDRNNLSATWYEAVFYSDKAVNKWLTLGFTFRVRFMQSYDAFDDPNTMIIPGFGRAGDKTVPAVNLFLKIEPF